MALSQATVIKQIRNLLAAIPGMVRVYAAGETEENAIPLAFNELPCAIVIPGPTLEFITSIGRHTYEVVVQVFESGGDFGARVNDVLPLVDRIIAAFAVNVTLGGRATSCVFARSSGLVGLEYGGISYTGYQITLNVSEQSYMQPAPGL